MGDKHELLFNFSDVKPIRDIEIEDDKTTFTISKAVYDKLLTAKNTLDIITAMVLADKGYDALRLIELLAGKENG